MSKEIKMSDMFDLPLVGSESPFVRDSSGNCVIYAQSKLNDISELERISRAKHAVHAINNHDRLTEENKRLSKQLTTITTQRDELLKDRNDAIAQMQKSWRWNEEKKDDLITRYVAMSNKQFAELDKLKQQRDDAEAALAILECKFDKLTDNKPKIPDGLMLSNLKKFQAWRLGEDERSLEEIGLTPKLVTATLDWAIEELEVRK